MSGDLRIGDAERTAAVERLSAHAAAGRLGVEELEQRVERAHAAVYARDLAALESDLPAAAAAAATAPAPTRRAPRPWPPAVPAIAVLAAAVIATAIVGHPVAPLFLAAALLWWRAARWGATATRPPWSPRPR